MTNLEIKNQCRTALLKKLGFTCTEDQLILDYFAVIGENEDILHAVSFRVEGGRHFSYYYNFLSDTFKIISRHYDGYVVA